MFRFTYGTTYLLAGSIVFASVLMAETAARCEESSTGIGEELKIMSKVLEASLDSSGIEDWHAASLGYSAFSSKIKHEYIPTDGAIFTIDVNFPLVEPEEEVAEAGEEEVDSDDLWEQMSRLGGVDFEFGNTREIIGIGVSLKEGDDGEIIVVGTIVDSPRAVRPRTLEITSQGSDVDFHRLEVFDGDVEFVIPRGFEGSHGVQLLQRNGLKLNVFDNSFHRMEYDAKKVETLRETLIGTVARYGHRMTQVGDSERILVVVNGPHGAGNRLNFWGEQSGALSLFGGRYGVDGDRILFSSDKGDLEEGLSVERLEKKVQEVAY